MMNTHFLMFLCLDYLLKCSEICEIAKLIDDSHIKLEKNLSIIIFFNNVDNSNNIKLLSFDKEYSA